MSLYVKVGFDASILWDNGRLRFPFACLRTIMNLGRSNYIDRLTTFKISKEDLYILPCTRGYQHKIFELIESAKKRIYITALYLQDDAAGAAVLTALYEAKKKNPQLDVKVFVDFLRAQRGLVGHKKSIGNIRLYRELNGLYQHPIKIYGVPVKSREFLGVLHLKGLVFDDTVLYSGASINDIYLHYADRYRADRYHVINSADLAESFVKYLNKNLASSQAVQSLTSTHFVSVKSIRQLIRRQKLSLRKSEYQFHSSRPVEETDISLTPVIGLGSRKNQLNKAILQLINQTKNEIIIFTPYFNFPAKVYKAVLLLLRKKIKVTVIVGDKKANDFFIPEGERFERIGILPYVYESNLKRFLKSNQKHIDAGHLDVNLWQDQSNSFHLKGINSDQSNYLITGHNINPRAWRLDLENGILIQDPNQQLLKKFADELILVMAHCTKVDHFDEIDNLSDYPVEVKRLLKNMKRTRFDKILNQLL
jgi:CDP-diacylglycerol--serine O-phosphatidyltransferase